MRWLFLLLLVLNVFYYLWHQQEAPLRAKDVTPLSLYRGSQQDIRLLSEAGESRDKEKAVPVKGQCFYIGGFTVAEPAKALVLRLADMGVKAQVAQQDLPDPGFWLSVAPEGQRLLGDAQLKNLSNEFNELKHKIMQCEGVAPAE